MSSNMRMHIYIFVHVCRVLNLLTDVLLLLFHVKGFVFSENEHTALEQFEGGPCAVIAPVQVLLN